MAPTALAPNQSCPKKPAATREKVLLPRRCSFLMPVPERLIPFMIEAGFGHVIQLRDFAFDAPLLSTFVECWRSETHTFCLPWCECTITL
ncbi:hypothetical protein PIB30_047482 [Stylosanthes scabra]|uniref:Aminotransferase-like plant mobile domain-containing protein n=1 Tax=Stylosanthes scabra TaxID=79078 RepID=A0ABU6RGT4_9FABA|nr:hypothetical protein [Stylosanthes scabra]